MRTSVKYLLLAAALLAALSCNKEKDIKDIQTPDTAFETVPYTFLATQEDNSTKTTLEGDQSVSWAVDDAVKFIYELDGVGGTAISSALEAEDISAGSANFTVSLPAAFKKTEEEYKEEGGTSLHLYAVYPSTSVVDPYSGGEFILTVPTEQDGSFANAAITLAKWNIQSFGRPGLQEHLRHPAVHRIRRFRSQSGILLRRRHHRGKSFRVLRRRRPFCEKRKIRRHQHYSQCSGCRHILPGRVTFHDGRTGRGTL